MGAKGRNWLKTLFITGYKPTQEDFADVFDSFVNKVDDQGQKSPILDILSAQEMAVSYGHVIPANSVAESYDFIKVSGNPKVKIGITPGGSEIMEETEVLGPLLYQYRYAFITTGSIYITVSGGIVSSNIIYWRNYWLGTFQ